MERPFNYHHLHYFRVIAELMSITEAAAMLKLAPSTLSDQLKTFEEELGVILFERKPRLRLTREGRIVLEHAREIISEGKRLRLRLDRPGMKAPLKLLFQDSVPADLKRRILSLLRGLDVPGISVQNFTTDPSIELRAQRFDLAIVSDFPADNAFEGAFLSERELVVSASPDLAENFGEATAILPPLITLEGKSADVWLKKRAIVPTQMIVSSPDEGILSGIRELVFSFGIPEGFVQIDRIDGCRRRFQIVRPAGDGAGVVTEIFSLLRRGL